jgi:hypothetical protein
MDKKLENHLETHLKKLEIAYRKILETQGYDKETEKIRILQEMIKEQTRNENTMHTTR